jgi:enoyl-CoA hydratase/carnithine racemase
MSETYFDLDREHGAWILRLRSEDGTNRLTKAVVISLTSKVAALAEESRPLVIMGNARFFSAGADLQKIGPLTGPSAYEFARCGQALMGTIDEYPAPVYAAISGYCMGGGLDLALACHQRIAAPEAVFGHRGAALGLITGWGGTQRLPRLVGRAIAVQMFVTAEKVRARRALEIGLVDAIVAHPLEEALRRINQ